MTTARECQWSAISDAGWLSLTSGASGQGTGAVAYSVAPNLSPTPRRGGIVVSGQRAEIAQEAAACTASVSPTTVSVGASGGEVRLTIATDEVCPWTAVSQAAWIAIESAPNGTGRAEVTLRIAANTGGERTGTATIAGADVTVSQAAVTCPVDVTPAAFTVAASGSSLEVSVTASAGCAWTTSATESWIQIVQGATGSGNGTVRLTILPNAGAARSGNLIVGGRTVRVDQAGGAAQCDYSISPSSLDAPVTGGPFQVQITTTGSSCTWEVTGTPGWISANPTSGTGTRPLTLTIQSNSGSARTASIAIGPRQMTVNQAGTSGPPPCSYTLPSTNTNVVNSAGTTSFGVTANAGCTWNAVSNAPAWLTITSGGNGTGSGTVNLSFTANTGAQRSGTVSVTGQGFNQNFTVTQGCTSSLSSASVTVPNTAGTTNFGVTSTGAGCTWNATSNAPTWLTITSGGGGTGNGTVNLSFTANTSAQRTGSVTVTGQNGFNQNFTVTQAGCTHSLSSTNVNVPHTAGTTSFTVTPTPSGCPWNATSNAPAWLTITSGGTGTVTGPVNLSVAANTGAQRTGTVTVTSPGGVSQTFTVVQAAPPCTYNVNPTTINAPKAGFRTTIGVATQSHCPVGATSNAPWITIVSVPAPGGGFVTIDVAMNPGTTTRTGTVTITGTGFSQPVTVIQLGS